MLIINPAAAENPDLAALARQYLRLPPFGLIKEKDHPFFAVFADALEEAGFRESEFALAIRNAFATSTYGCFLVSDVLATAAAIAGEADQLNRLKDAYDRQQAQFKVLAEQAAEYRRQAEEALVVKTEKNRLRDRRSRALRPVREWIGMVGDPTPIVIVDGDQEPKVTGRSYHWTTIGGRPIEYPGAYRWPKVYHHSTRQIEVGRGWLIANGVVWEGD